MAGPWPTLLKDRSVGRDSQREYNASGHITLSCRARGKLVHAELRASQREVRTWYSGLGQVAAHRWQHTLGGDFQLDEFRSDPYGNVAWSRELDALQVAGPAYTHSYDVQGRLLERLFGGLESGVNVFRAYDGAGRVSYATELPHVQNEGEVQRRVSRHDYSAEGKLVRLERYARERLQGTVGNDDLIQEIRYDALGRRILVRTQHAPFGAVEGHDAITRMVWDGSQLLGELRAPGGEEDNLEAAYGSGAQYGRVAYVHGGALAALDAPLGVYRKDFSSSGPTLIVPFANWRGQYERGSFLFGDPECTGSNTDCITVDWPAPELRTYLDGAPGGGPGDWVGSLIQDQRDASGLLYRRNRYYDPATGQFTQEDPIGIAGGLSEAPPLTAEQTAAVGATGILLLVLRLLPLLAL
ncbi:MAG TPA: RHS repeat-associated core domain-containing protein [Longimicrobiales bacterium]